MSAAARTCPSSSVDSCVCGQDGMGGLRSMRVVCKVKLGVVSEVRT